MVKLNLQLASNWKKLSDNLSLITTCKGMHAASITGVKNCPWQTQKSYILKWKWNNTKMRPLSMWRVWSFEKGKIFIICLCVMPFACTWLDWEAEKSSCFKFCEGFNLGNCFALAATWGLRAKKQKEQAPQWGRYGFKWAWPCSPRSWGPGTRTTGWPTTRRRW